MADLLFIRHGESIWNAAGRWQGQADPPLSEVGRRQADALADGLRGESLALLAASDLVRAAETARMVGEALGLTPRLVPELRELDVGIWSGLRHAEIEARFPDELARFRAGDLEVRPGGGESRAEFRRRVCGALDRLFADAPGGVAVVSHLGVLRAVRPAAVLRNAAWVRLSRDELTAHAGGYHGDVDTRL